MATEFTEKLSISAIFLVILALVLHYSKKWRLYRSVSKFPGPPAIPILGNALQFFGDPSNSINIFNNLMDTYSSPYRIWLGSEAILVTCDPEQIKTILLSPKCMGKMFVYDFAKPWVGAGLVTAPGPIWRKHRKMIMPTFHQETLNSFISVFAKQSEIMTELMRKELKGSEFAVSDYVSLCTLDIICETAMGITFNAQVNPQRRYVTASRRIFEIMWMRACKAWLCTDYVFQFLPSGKEHLEALTCLLDTAEDVIRRKKKQLRDNAHCSKDNNCQEKSSEKKAFLDHILEISTNKEKFTDEELRDEVNTMIVAGYDTTATMDSFVLLMLAMHPEVQDKVHQELCEIYRNKVSPNDAISNQDLNCMEYLERVIKETLRLFPVAPIIGRSITEDLDIGGCTLPKDSSVVLGIMKLHRSEKYWPDPMKFDPDRFLPDEVAKRHPDCYIPFSAGPRNCIGLKYAMMAMKVLISTVVRHYVLKKDEPLKIEDIKLRSNVVLQPMVPLTIRIEKR